MNNELPPHWMHVGLVGANGSFQRAAREYAEEYGQLCAQAARQAALEEAAKLCELRGLRTPKDAAYHMALDLATNIRKLKEQK